MIYVGPDGAISDRELTDNEGPPTRLPIRKSSVSSSTRSLVRKLESIEGEEPDCVEENSQRFSDRNFTTEGNEDNTGRVDEKSEGETFVAREEGEGTELTEEYTEDSCYETEIENLPENRASNRKRLFCNKDSSMSCSEGSKGDVKRVKTLQDVADEKRADVEATAKEKPTTSVLNTLIIPSQFGSNLDAGQPLNGGDTVVIPVASFPGEETKLRARVMSPETSSESSDAESIVMAKAPSFSFLTCDAVNDIDSESLNSLNTEEDCDRETSHRSKHGPYSRGYEPAQPDVSTNGIASESRDSLNTKQHHFDCDVCHHYDGKTRFNGHSPTTEELVKNCMPSSPTTDSAELCYVLEEKKETSSDDFSYDDTELVWGKRPEDEAIIADAFCEAEAYVGEEASQRNYTGNETDVLFPELEKSLQETETTDTPRIGRNVQAIAGQPRQGSDESSAESDTDVARSCAFETPMKLFYRLVPSPQSSSTEEELEDIQMSKSFNTKVLSPIPECPSVESNLNRSPTESKHSAESRASCGYSIVSVEIDDGNNSVRVEGEHEGGSSVANMTESNSSGDFRSLLQKFVAEQLRECEGEKFSSRYARPVARHPEYRRPRPRQSRRIIPLSSCDSSGSDVLLPPLQPLKRTCTETAKLISSPKLRYRNERDYDSDIVQYNYRDGDESSDSSRTAKTEPWYTPLRSVVRPNFNSTPKLSSISVENMKTSVTFLGCEDENNNFCKADSADRTCAIEDINKHIDHSDVSRVVGANISPDRISVTSVSSFVKLTYCGSEVSDTEFEKPDELSRNDEPSSRALVSKAPQGMSISVQRPIIEYIPITPETPYAPQEEFIARFQDRCAPPRVIYRLSGEFVATIPSDETRKSDDEAGGYRQYRVSGEFVATFTTASETHNTSTLMLTPSSSDDKAKTESTEVVWVANEPAVSTGEVTADELSAPATPISLGSRNGKLNRFKFFG